MCFRLILKSFAKSGLNVFTNTMGSWRQSKLICFKSCVLEEQSYIVSPVLIAA